MSEKAEATAIGSGISVFESPEDPEGTIHYVTNAQEVIQLVSGDVDGVIGLVRAGTCSFASPLLSNGVTGLITMEGAPTSHLGILSREFNIPCIMSMEPVEDIEGVDPESDGYFQQLGSHFDGRDVRLDTSEGVVYDLGGAGT